MIKCWSWNVSRSLSLSLLIFFVFFLKTQYLTAVHCCQLYSQHWLREGRRENFYDDTTHLLTYGDLYISVFVQQTRWEVGGGTTDGAQSDVTLASQTGASAGPSAPALLSLSLSRHSAFSGWSDRKLDRLDPHQSRQSKEIIGKFPFLISIYFFLLIGRLWSLFDIWDIIYSM